MPEMDSQKVAECIGIGYTIATGRLYTNFNALIAAAEDIMGRPVSPLEFGSEAFMAELRETFEAAAAGTFDDVAIVTPRVIGI